MRLGFGEIVAGGTSNIPSLLPPSSPTVFFFFLFFFLQAPILTGITGFTARPIETLSRVAVKLAAPYSAFHYG